MTTEEQQLNTEGVVRVGELDTRVMREARTAEDHRNSVIAGSVKAYLETDGFIAALLRAAGPYDDTRTMLTIRTWLGDRIREVQSPATMEDPHV